MFARRVVNFGASSSKSGRIGGSTPGYTLGVVVRSVVRPSVLSFVGLGGANAPWPCPIASTSERLAGWRRQPLGIPKPSTTRTSPQTTALPVLAGKREGEIET